MDTEFIVLVIMLVVGFLGLFFLLKKKPGSESPLDNGALLMLQNQLNELTRTLDGKLGESSKLLQSQFGESAKIVRDVTEKLTKLDETNRQVINFTEQLRELQDILKNPKQRGVIGEYYLETLLKNVMPPGSYEMQYDLGTNDKTGQKLIADAVIHVREKLIPVDSKFSLENYNRLVEARSDDERERYEKAFVNDLKLRIQETAKYIQPDRGTLEFAFMFIPHEAIYYDLLINKIGSIDESAENLIQRAAAKYRVIIVSPTSFLAYLQTVLQGLRAMQIEESAKDIRKNVEGLGKHIAAYNDYFEKLGTHLGRTVESYNEAGKRLKYIDTDVTKITGDSIGIEVPVLDKPKD